MSSTTLWNNFTITTTAPSNMALCPAPRCQDCGISVRIQVIPRLKIRGGPEKTPHGWLCKDCQLKLNLRRWCV